MNFMRRSRKRELASTSLLTASGGGGIVRSRPIFRKGVPIADLEVGAVVEGAVQRITPYGAFLQLDDGKVGLIHISEIDRNYVRNGEDHLHLNDRAQAKVVPIKEDGQIDLSINAVLDPPPRIHRRAARDPEFGLILQRGMRQLVD